MRAPAAAHCRPRPAAGNSSRITRRDALTFVNTANRVLPRLGVVITAAPLAAVWQEGSMPPVEIHRSALVGRSAERTFDLIEAAEHYPAFLPWCVGAVILARDDGLVVARLTVNY